MFDLYLKCLIGSDILTSFITLFVCKDTTFSETGKDLDEKVDFTVRPMIAWLGQEGLWRTNEQTNKLADR